MQHPFVSPARERLAESVRHLIDAVLTCEDATEEQLGTAADMTEGVATHLGRPRHNEKPSRERAQRSGARERAQRSGARERARSADAGATREDDYLPRSPLVGEVSPLAPPVAWEYRDGRIRGRGVYHAAYEGPPGYVHGGWVALTFDEILGMANIASGHPGMTGTLKIRYLRPTPLHEPVDLEGWTERVEGRRIVAKGTMSVAGTVTAEAEGLFVTIDPELAAKYFGPERGEAAPAGVADL